MRTGGALAAPGAVPDFEQFAGPGIDEAFFGESPVPAGRRVEGLALITAAPEQKPDQNEGRGDHEPEKDHEHAGHGAGSITAAVP